MITAIKKWIEDNSWITHFIASAFTFLTLAYASNSTFQTYINHTAMTIYHALPAWVAQLIVGAVIPLYLIYRQQLSATGKKMMAREEIKKAVDDPDATKAKAGTKLPVAAAIAFASATLLCLSGCTFGAGVQKAAEILAGTLPSVLNVEQAAVAVLAAVDPAIGAPILAFQPIITAGITELESLLNTYNGAPDAATWAKCVTVVDSLVANGDEQLLTASRISDPATKAKVTGVIASLDAFFHIMDAAVQQTQSSAQVKKTMTARRVKMKTVMSMLDSKQKSQVANAWGFEYSQPALDVATAKGY